MCCVKFRVGSPPGRWGEGSLPLSRPASLDGEVDYQNNQSSMGFFVDNPSSSVPSFPLPPHFPSFSRNYPILPFFFLLPRVRQINLYIPPFFNSFLLAARFYLIFLTRVDSAGVLSGGGTPPKTDKWLAYRFLCFLFFLIA